MASGMWTAAAGAAVQSQNLDIIANNLANADTNAFKKDLPTFKEYLVAAEKGGAPKDIPRGPIKDQDIYPPSGKDQAYVVMDGTHTSHAQGHLRVTHSPLDVALDGPGMLEVNTPAGIRYTRDGALRIASDGRLVTREGFPVLAESTLAANPAVAGAGAGTAARFINLKDVGPQVSINEKGEIFSGEDQIAKLSVVEVANLNTLKKTAGQLFEAGRTTVINPSSQTSVRQGVLETSNVNPIEEMTNMIKSNRLFEHDLKALKTYGELMAKEVNEVGKL